MTDDEFLTLADYLLQKATSDELRTRLIALARIGAAVKPRPIEEAVLKDFQRIIEGVRRVADTREYSIERDKARARLPTLEAILSALPQPEPKP